MTKKKSDEELLKENGLEPISIFKGKFDDNKHKSFAVSSHKVASTLRAKDAEIEKLRKDCVELLDKSDSQYTVNILLKNQISELKKKLDFINKLYEASFPQRKKLEKQISEKEYDLSQAFNRIDNQDLEIEELKKQVEELKSRLRQWK